MNLREKIKRFFHIGMEQVRVHDGCGGWIFYVEYVCGIQMQCSKCGKRWEGYWYMGEQPSFHLEWKSKQIVAKFYGEVI